MNAEAKKVYNNRFASKLYGLLCEREKNREWERFLDSILIELMGRSEEDRDADFYILFYKLSTLKYLKYEYFRGTIFDCMDLVSR